MTDVDAGFGRDGGTPTKSALIAAERMASFLGRLRGSEESIAFSCIYRLAQQM